VFLGAFLDAVTLTAARLRVACVACVLLGLVWSAPARAEPERAPRAYTEQVLIADGASIGIVAGGYGVASAGERKAGSKVAVVGAVSWLVAAPAIHFAHRRPGIGVLDLAMRVTIPVGVYAAFDKSSTGATLAVVSAGAISTLDALWFARPADGVPYRAGMELGPEDRLVSRPRWMLVGIGMGTFMLTYAAVGGVPIVTPFHAVGKALVDPGRFRCPNEGPVPCPVFHAAGAIAMGMLVADGALQLGGLALAAAGFLYPEKSVITRASSVTLRPILSSSSVGVSGTF
jgi:hypothetical protein